MVKDFVYTEIIWPQPPLGKGVGKYIEARRLENNLKCSVNTAKASRETYMEAELYRKTRSLGARGPRLLACGPLDWLWALRAGLTLGTHAV